MKREFPPYLSYLFVTVTSVALLSMQATLPFKLKELGRSLDDVGFLFTWTSFWYVMSGVFLGWISHHVGPRRVMLVSLAICAVMAFAMPAAKLIWQVYALATVYFMSICLYWAASEHAAAGMNERLSLVQSTSIYCVSFSAGNGLGTLFSLHL